MQIVEYKIECYSFTERLILFLYCLNNELHTDHVLINQMRSQRKQLCPATECLLLINKMILSDYHL